MIRVKITVEDKTIKFDYSDTDKQTNGFVNGTYTSSASATVLTFSDGQSGYPTKRRDDGADRDRHSGRYYPTTPAIQRRRRSAITCARPMLRQSSAHWRRSSPTV